MRRLWTLLAAGLALFELHPALGTNSGSAAPLQNDPKFAALAVAPVLPLALLAVLERPSRERRLSRVVLAVLGACALSHVVFPHPTALLLALIVLGWVGAFASGALWALGRSQAPR